MPHSYAQHDLVTPVTQLAHIGDMANSYMWHYSCMSVASHGASIAECVAVCVAVCCSVHCVVLQCVAVFGATHPCGRHHTGFMCMTRLIHM